MKRLFLIPLLMLLCTAAGSAAEVPSLQSPVNDYAGVISQAQENELRSMLLNQEKETGNQIVILTVKKLDGDTIETFAEKVFNTWKLGHAKKDNGVLVVAAVDDRVMRIEVGYGLEGVLTDALCSQIIRKEMAPKFKEKDFGGGFVAAVTAIEKAVKGEYTVEESIVNWWVILLIVAIVLLLILLDVIITGGNIVGLIFAIGSGGGGGGYGGGGGGSGGGGASGSW